MAGELAERAGAAKSWMCLNLVCRVYSSGMGAKGQLGHGDMLGRETLTPVARLCGRGINKIVAVSSLHSVEFISICFECACAVVNTVTFASSQAFDSYRVMAVATSGMAYAWGGGPHAQLGTLQPRLLSDVNSAKRRASEDDNLSDIEFELG